MYNMYSMAKINNLKSIIEEVLEEKLEEKFEEHLGPIKAAIISLEKSVSFTLGDYKDQQIRVSNYIHSA